jgi:hypothetical protein
VIDASEKYAHKGVTVYEFKRLTPANQICDYAEFTEGRCEMTRCRKYFTEKELKVEADKQNIMTNSYEFAKQYKSGIRYRGESYQQQHAEMQQEVKQKEIQAAMNFWGVITRQPNEWTRKYREQENKRRTDALIQQGQRIEQFNKNVDQVKQQQLQVPDASTCSRYKEKDEYNSFNKAALYGVKPGMLLRDMHDALMCNGFTPNAKIVTAAGGLDKYLAIPNKVVYTKILADATKLTTEIGVVPLTYQQRKSGDKTLKLKTFSVLHTPMNGINDSEWSRIQSEFTDQYDVGGRKNKNRYGMTFIDQRKGMSIGLQAKYTMQRGIFGYYITVCCGK